MYYYFIKVHEFFSVCLNLCQRSCENIWLVMARCVIKKRSNLHWIFIINKSFKMIQIFESKSDKQYKNMLLLLFVEAPLITSLSRWHCAFNWLNFTFDACSRPYYFPFRIKYWWFLTQYVANTQVGRRVPHVQVCCSNSRLSFPYESVYWHV